MKLYHEAFDRGDYAVGQPKIRQLEEKKAHKQEAEESKPVKA